MNAIKTTYFIKQHQKLSRSSLNSIWTFHNELSYPTVLCQYENIITVWCIDFLLPSIASDSFSYPTTKVSAVKLRKQQTRKVNKQEKLMFVYREPSQLTTTTNIWCTRCRVETWVKREKNGKEKKYWLKAKKMHGKNRKTAAFHLDASRFCLFFMIAPVLVKSASDLHHRFNQISLEFPCRHQPSS